MNYRKTIDIVNLKLIILTLLIFLFPINFIAAQEYSSFRFVVTADSRCDNAENPDLNTCLTDSDSYVNEVVFNRVLDSIRNHNPAFVVFAGDMVLGRRVTTPVQNQLNAWKGLMEDKDFPLTKIMPAWGGHEKDLEANGVYTAWQNVFDPAAAFDPEGGANCQYPQGYGNYGNTVYYCDYQNARFFVLNNDIDCSIDGGNPFDESTCLKHQIGPNQRRWISDNSTGQDLYFFVYHEAAYGTCAHQQVDIDGGIFETMDQFPDARNTFIETIDSFATMSFSGHEHQYSRRRINNSLYSEIPVDDDPPISNRAIQGDFLEVKTGTSGAPIYSPYDPDNSGNNPDNYEAPCMDNVEAYEGWPDKYYYSVIEVDNRGAQPIVSGTTYAVDAGPLATEAVDFFAQPDPKVWYIGGPGVREEDWIYFGSNTSDTPPPVDGSGRSWTDPEYVPGSGWLPGCMDDFPFDYNNGLRRGIGYGDGDDCTPIPPNTFLDVYARKMFNLDPTSVGDDLPLTLAVNFDDDFEAFINGEPVGTWPREGPRAAGNRGHHEAGSSGDPTGSVTVPDGDVVINWEHKRPPEQYPLDAAKVQSALAGRTEHVLAIRGGNKRILSGDFSLAASLRKGMPTCVELQTYPPIPYCW